MRTKLSQVKYLAIVSLMGECWIGDLKPGSLIPKAVILTSIHIASLCFSPVVTETKKPHETQILRELRVQYIEGGVGPQLNWHKVTQNLLI